MSTRATLTVKDEYASFHLYIHSDGMPFMVLPQIEEALSFSWKFPRFEAWEFITALIKVMKKSSWGIYLINSVNEVSDRAFNYRVSEENWDLKIEIDYINNEEESSSIEG